MKEVSSTDLKEQILYSAFTYCKMLKSSSFLRFKIIFMQESFYFNNIELICDFGLLRA